ncbi:histidinol-phosphate transaminase [Homoserinimonas hongtaonis]|uniref:Histidinol-phosphate transaminase n=1 Tax=Homoserinimonas hongtaonis TaxID=2079791 RepID=A0A2U1T1X5_9MICO|nr:histidinol-phosphate transaminase [Salinibacterium hongtaonis]AWB90417.1 aminotransferase [Salinibacterium hongtaonis]PWB97858.1 histidinol-phosphate transaminase [Salinibacterium hongtaonis]
MQQTPASINKVGRVSPATEPPVRIRPEILQSVAYQQGKQAPAEAFKLSSNENPYPTHPAVMAAIASATPNRYPDALATELRELLAERYGVAVDEVHVGAGSVSILAQLISAVAGPGDEVLFSWRSFEAYPGLVTVAGATSVMVPNRADAGHDIDAMIAAVTPRTRAIIVCSPNNPTGTIVTRAEFERLMAAVPSDVLVMLDEAYIEFTRDEDAVRGTDYLGTHANLVVLRTFSKAYGLAGVRIGYALGNSAILAAARTAAIPLSVTEAAQRGAVAALHYEAEIMELVDTIVERRDSVWHSMRELGLEVPQPHGNFVWFAAPGRAAEVAEVFLTHGIVARALGNDGVRVTVGEAESVDKLLKASAEVVGMLPTAPHMTALD